LVRPAVTILLVLALIILSYLEQIGIGTVAARIGDAALMVLAFWFGSRQKPEQAAR
jgi:hypothetical protein